MYFRNFHCNQKAQEKTCAFLKNPDIEKRVNT
jgi:hypothetical protein